MIVSSKRISTCPWKCVYYYWCCQSSSCYQWPRDRSCWLNAFISCTNRAHLSTSNVICFIIGKLALYFCRTRMWPMSNLAAVSVLTELSLTSSCHLILSKIESCSRLKSWFNFKLNLVSSTDRNTWFKHKYHFSSYILPSILYVCYIKYLSTHSTHLVMHWSAKREKRVKMTRNSTFTDRLMHYCCH